MSKENTSQSVNEGLRIYATEKQRRYARKIAYVFTASVGVTTILSAGDVKTAGASEPEHLYSPNPIPVHVIDDYRLKFDHKILSPISSPKATRLESELSSPDDDPLMLYCAPIAIGAGLIILLVLKGVGEKKQKRQDDQLQRRDAYIRGHVQHLREVDEERSRNAQAYTNNPERQRREDEKKKREEAKRLREEEKQRRMEAERRQRELDAMAELQFLFELLQYQEYLRRTSHIATESNRSQSSPAPKETGHPHNTQRPGSQRRSQNRQSQGPNQHNQGEFDKQRVEETRADYLQQLGLPKNASQKDVRKAYRELARKYHPEAPENRGLSDKEIKERTEKFLKVAEAYEKLGKPGR